jgi:hypothetical protein
VQNEIHSAVGNYEMNASTTNVTNKEVKQLTLNGSFPLMKILNNYDKKECAKIINSIIEEIKKEKKDDFPYSLAFHETLQINFCIKNNKLFNIINIFLFFLIMVRLLSYLILVLDMFRYSFSTLHTRFSK